jgi:pimeloyl-ACP methyl ester carboxylesterase
MIDFNQPEPEPVAPWRMSPAPPVYMVSGTPGTGKTWRWIELIAIPAIERGEPVVVSVPRLDLADEIAKAFADRDVYAAVYRGREASDPQVRGAKMCREGDRVAAINGAMAQVSQKACKTNDAECQFYNICGYQAQQKLKCVS